MWIIGYLVFLILFLLLLAYSTKPEALLKFVHKLTPKKVKSFLRKVEAYLLENYVEVYGFTAFAIIVIVFSFTYSFADLSLGMTEESTEIITSTISLSLVVGISIVYVILFFNKYFTIPTIINIIKGFIEVIH